MDEYIRREAVLKSLEYTTVWEAEAENVIALTLRAAREKLKSFLLCRKKTSFPHGATLKQTRPRSKPKC